MGPFFYAVDGKLTEDSYNEGMSNNSIPPIAPGTTPPAQAGQVVQITSLPDGLLTVSRAMHLEAEVVRQNADGTTRVRTAEGEMDLNIRGKQPQVGQKLEVDIPPGNPPRNATVRTAPPQPAQPLPQQPPTQGGQALPQPNIPLPQTPVTQPPVQGQTPQPLPGQPAPPPATGQTPRPATPPTGTTTPVTVDVNTKPSVPFDGAYQPPTSGAATPKSTPPIPTPTLSADQIIRLTALPQPVTGQAPIVSATPNITLTPQTEKTGLIANLMAQKSQGTLVTSLLQAVKSALPPAIANTLPGTTIQTNGTQVTPSIKTTLTSPPPNPAGIIPVTEGGPILQIPVGAVLEAKIIAIKSPTGQMQILSPQTNVQTNTMPTPGIVTPTADNNATPKPMNITVNVTGFTAQKMPIIALPLAANAPAQNFVLQIQAPTLQPGSQLTLTPQISTATTAPIATMPPAWRALLPLMQPSSLWPAVDDIFQTFFQTTPQAAQILGRIIPSPANPSNMGPAIMLLAAAIRAGDLQGWMGDKKLEMLQKLGKGDLLSRLSGETSSLAANNDTPSTEWKSVPVPILWQNEISKVLFHVRQEPQDDNDEQGDIGTRFIFDLDLTTMGAVQLDGLVRGNRLDLIVRTKESISYPMQEAMKKAYADALDGTQIYGELGFQGDLKSWMVITGNETMNVST